MGNQSPRRQYYYIKHGDLYLTLNTTTGWTLTTHKGIAYAYDNVQEALDIVERVHVTSDKFTNEEGTAILQIVKEEAL